MESVNNKILFDLSFILSRSSLFTGVAKYAYRLLEYIVKANRQGHYILLLNSQTAEDVMKMFPQFGYVIIGKKWMDKLKFFKYFAYMLEFKKAVNRTFPKLVFCPSSGPVGCLKVKPPKISVIHDLQVRVDAKLLKKRDVWIYTFAEDSIIENADYVFTISNFSKKQILSFYPEAYEKVLNMSNSVSMLRPDDLKPMRPGFNYILYCGRLCVQKNVLTLLKAFNLIRNHFHSLKLVLLAKQGDYWESVLKPYAENNGFLSDVILTGGCSEEELSRWYLGADCFVFPSLREGFGSPPLEAAFMHVPVVTSKSDSLEEVTLGLLNYYEPTNDEIKLAEAIKNVLVNPPSSKQLGEIANEYQKHYSIDVVGKNICDFLEHFN